MWNSRLGKRTASIVPAPLLIQPLGEFDGNNGPWSTFPIQVGTPPQLLKILPSTAGSQTWVVLTQGCTQNDPSNCSSARGGRFHPNSSSTWNQNGAAANGLFPLLLEANLNTTSDVGYYGYDTVVLGDSGSNGPRLDQQAVAGIAAKDFYLGVFGLNPQASILPGQSRVPLPDYVSQLNSSGTIPSLSWSYTAGNQYRPAPAYGNLVLGGYDASRFESNDITFPFNEADLSQFTVNIGAIYLTTDGTPTILTSDNQSIAAVVDSTTPFLHLPLNVCEQFEIAFGITWNTAVQAYLVNDSLNDALLSQNTSVVFNLGNSSTIPGQGFNISLPYSAFNLVAEAPFLTHSGRYFPLMRNDNASQYTLGRTFLQEAYLIADYERNNFSVSQCTWDAGAESHIVPIKSLDNSTNRSHGISTGAIVGIVISAVSIVIILTMIGIYFRRRRRPKEFEQKDRNAFELDSPEKDPYIAMSNKRIGHRSHIELDAVEHKGHEIDGRPWSGQDSGIEGQRFELDATERQSRTLSSPISQMSERSDATRLHQRQMSDPVSLSSDVSTDSKDLKHEITSQETQKKQRSDATRLHKRELSDPVSLTSAISDSSRERTDQVSLPISPTSDRSETALERRRDISEPISLVRERSDAARLQRLQSSDPKSPMRARSDASRSHKRDLSDPVSLLSDRAEEGRGAL